MPSPNPPSESGYGVLVEWENLPNGFFAFPPPDINNQSSVGWIHDGVVTIGIGYFLGTQQQKVSIYPIPNYGNGSFKDGLTALRTSVMHWAANWMGLFAPCIQNLKLNELTLPGTHDAGTYPANGITQPWVQTQYLSIQQQLEQGVRCLDLRLLIDGIGDTRFQICHNGHTVNLPLGNILDRINSFLSVSSNSKEVVILDFHQFEKYWTDQDYKDVAELIVKKIGKDKLIPSSAQAQSLKEIWKTSSRVVVGSREFGGNVSSYPFWSNSVEQFWCGSSVTTWSSVQTYMQDILDDINTPKDHLWALMAQYNYTVPSIGKPAYVPAEISSFFSGLNGIKSNIIDTDWWNRVNNTWMGHTEIQIPNFSALIKAVPLNIMKGYRRNNQMPLWN